MQANHSCSLGSAATRFPRYSQGAFSCGSDVYFINSPAGQDVVTESKDGRNVPTKFGISFGIFGIKASLVKFPNIQNGQVTNLCWL
jgi:hypothetical protein